MKYDWTDFAGLAVIAIGVAFLACWNAAYAGGEHGGERYRICAVALRDLEAGTVLGPHDTAIRLRPIGADNTDYFDDQATLKDRQLKSYVLRGDVIRRGSLVRDRLLCSVLFTVKIEPSTLAAAKGARVALIPPGTATAAPRIFIVEAPPVNNVLTLRATHAQDAVDFARATQPFRLLVVPPR